MARIRGADPSKQRLLSGLFTRIVYVMTRRKVGRVTLAGHVTSLRRLFARQLDFERNRDLDEAAGAADAIACSGGGSLCGMMQDLVCR